MNPKIEHAHKRQKTFHNHDHSLQQPQQQHRESPTAPSGPRPFVAATPLLSPSLPTVHHSYEASYPSANPTQHIIQQNLQHSRFPYPLIMAKQHSSIFGPQLPNAQPQPQHSFSDTEKDADFARNLQQHFDTVEQQIEIDAAYSRHLANEFSSASISPHLDDKPLPSAPDESINILELIAPSGTSLKNWLCSICGSRIFSSEDRFHDLVSAWIDGDSPFTPALSCPVCHSEICVACAKSTTPTRNAVDAPSKFEKALADAQRLLKAFRHALPDALFLQDVKFCCQDAPSNLLWMLLVYFDYQRAFHPEVAAPALSPSRSHASRLSHLTDFGHEEDDSDLWDSDEPPDFEKTAQAQAKAYAQALLGPGKHHFKKFAGKKGHKSFSQQAKDIHAKKAQLAMKANMFDNAESETLTAAALHTLASPHVTQSQSITAKESEAKSDSYFSNHVKSMAEATSMSQPNSPALRLSGGGPRPAGATPAANPTFGIPASNSLHLNLPPNLPPISSLALQPPYNMSHYAHGTPYPAGAPVNHIYQTPQYGQPLPFPPPPPPPSQFVGHAPHAWGVQGYWGSLAPPDLIPYGQLSLGAKKNGSMQANGTGYGGSEYYKSRRRVEQPIEEHKKAPTQSCLDRDTLTQRVITLVARLFSCAVGEQTFATVSVAHFISSSTLLEAMAEVLRNDSLEDALKRRDLYIAVIECVTLLASNTQTNHIVHAERYKKPHSKLLYPKKGKDREDCGDMLPSLQSSMKNLVVQSNVTIRGASRLAKRSSETQDLVRLCNTIASLSDFLCVATQTNVTTPTPVPMAKEDKHKLWTDFHTKNCFSHAPDALVFAGHAYAIEAQKTNTAPIGRMKRLLSEAANLSTSLPPGIFVRYAESRPDVLKAIIIGPSGTPYANGIFEFDFWCPPSYPSVPPLCKFKTTGSGRAHFNPNLYRNGYVCLSLLNTWEGERWAPGQSTLLQILVSMQAMIFCDQPWFNEPGRERRFTSLNDHEVKAYNKKIQILTVKWAMLDWLEVGHAGKTGVANWLSTQGSHDLMGELDGEKRNAPPESVWRDVVVTYVKLNGSEMVKSAFDWAGQQLRPTEFAMEANELKFRVSLVERELTGNVVS